MLPETEVSWPIRVGAVPPTADCYQQRAEASVLASILDDGSTAVRTQVLVGLGGGGKTQLAVGCVRAAEACSDLVMWISATTRDAVVSAYAQAAHMLGYRFAGEPGQAADWLLNWLTTDHGVDWLIVLDDLIDPADMRGLWPRGPRGRTLVTTRRTDAALSAQGRRLLQVGLYSPGEAREYLQRKLGDGSDLSESGELAADLGHLPLALAQAGAFMLDRGESCAGYRRRLGDRRRSLADVFPSDALADDYQGTVAAAWSLSIDLADRLVPAGLGRPLLQLASVLDPNGFPAELVETEAATIWLQPEQPDPVAARDALHNLARLSLLGLDPKGGVNAVRVHGLVQRAARETMPVDMLADAALMAAYALEEIWPEFDRAPQLGQVLLANALAMLPYAGAALLSPTVHHVLYLMGESFLERGLDDFARAHVAAVVRDARHHLGADHYDVLYARYKLAILCCEEEPAATLEESRSLADDCTRVLGADDTLTLQAQTVVIKSLELTGDLPAAVAEATALLNHHHALDTDVHETMRVHADLARLRGRAGDHEEAIAELRKLLADAGHHFGLEHKATQEIAEALAAERGAAGGLDATIAAYADLVRERTAVLGADDRSTLAARLAGAKARFLAGDPAGAATDLSRLLPDARRTLGAHDRDVFEIRSVLAHSRGDSGEPAVAVQIYEDLLVDLMPVVGPANTLVLSIRHELTGYRQLTGDITGAIADLTRLVTDRQRLLGDDHPHTAGTRQSLADAYRAAGDLPAAAEIYRTLASDIDDPKARNREGKIHMLVALAEIQVKLDDAPGALISYQKLAERCAEMYGTEDPDTMRVRWRAAGVEATLDPVTSIPRLKELLAEQVRLFGNNTEETLSCRRFVFDAMLMADQISTADVLYELLADQQRVLGPDHPETLRTRAELVFDLVPDEGVAPVEMHDLFADLVRVLGPEDFSTLNVRYLLVRLGYGIDLQERLTQARQLLADQRNVFYDDGDQILETRWMIAFLEQRSGDLTAAIEDLRQLIPDVERDYGGPYLDLDHGRASLVEWESEARRR